MRRPFPLLAVLALALVFTSGAAAAQKGQALDMYRATVDSAELGELVAGGYDVAAVRPARDGYRVDLVLSAGERSALADKGIATGVIRNKAGLSVRQQARAQSRYGFDVWRSWDEPGGIRDELYALAARHRKIVKLKVIGRSVQGRPIVALKVTGNARNVPDGTRPAAIYMSTIHAREWISTEVNRRLLHHFVDNYGRNREITKLVNTRELWFVVVSNPDGYQYTFDTERLWRKNLRDNNGNGSIAIGDGVDLNRNYASNWGYDNEGSQAIQSSDTYRGPSPASEPETKAVQGLIDRLARKGRLKFLVTYHSYGPLMLYNWGWQVQTPSADDPLYVAYTGTDDNPAVAGFDPGVAADLYITNGTTDDYSYAEGGALSWTPELEEGCAGCGFVFPDDEALVQAQFEKNLPFAMSLARSAPNPAKPRTHTGISVEPFYLDVSEIDPEKVNNPLSDMTFDVSYGDPQPARVLASRSLGKVTLKWRVNGGKARSARTSEWGGGERFGGAGRYYHYVQGSIHGTKPGDSVQVWFEATVDDDDDGKNDRRKKGKKGKKGKNARGDDDRVVKSDSFTYRAASETGNDVLVLAAEDYSGISGGYPAGPRPYYVSHYLDALAANGIAADVYDVDANGRKAPSPLGVLGHYDAVVWYTGEDIITRDPGMVGGTASRLANDEMLAVRQYLNEGGRLLYTGKWAGVQYAFGYAFDLEGNRACGVDPAAECQPLSDDFLQYYLGAYVLNFDAGLDENFDPYGLTGTDTPFTGLDWTLNGPGSAGHQDVANSFITTSGILPASQFPQFTSWAAAKYDRPGGPFSPHSGSQYAYSQIADITYKRLTRTVAVPAGGGNLSFWTSYDTEHDWDYVFVEARTPGMDDWTTLPDQNGNTGQATGESCKASNSGGWRTLHPQLDHYQTQVGADGCSPSGTTGAWHAAEANSGGWQQWSVHLDPARWTGGQVEISITYASDWGTQGLGVFVDDIVTPTGDGSTDFESGSAGWVASGAPADSAANANDWIVTSAAGFPEAAVVATGDTLFMGFGAEGITGAERNAVMGRAMAYLLRP